MAALMQQEGRTIAAALGEEQYAAGRGAGLEALFRHEDSALAAGSRGAALLFDTICALNAMYRECMLEEVVASLPELVTAFAVWLARPSRTALILEDGSVRVYAAMCGAGLGCPGPPAAFAFGMRRALRRVWELMPP